MSEDEQDEFSAAMKNPYRYTTHTCSVEDTIRDPNPNPQHLQKVIRHWATPKWKALDLSKFYVLQG